MKEIKLTKENVLAAAKTCPAAKEALMKLAPEAFGDDEEWENITAKVKWSPELNKATGNYFMRFKYLEKDIGIIEKGKLVLYPQSNTKVEFSGQAGRILKRTNQ